jgi:hypothetical protein
MLPIRQKIEDSFVEPTLFDALITAVELAIFALEWIGTFLPQI